MRDITVKLIKFDQDRDMWQVAIYINGLTLCENDKNPPYWWNGVGLEGLDGPFSTVLSDDEWDYVEQLVPKLLTNKNN